MTTTLKRTLGLALLLGAFGSLAQPAHALVSVSSTAYQNAKGVNPALLLQAKQALTYTLTGTCTGQVWIEKSRSGDNFGLVSTDYRFTMAGVVSQTGVIYTDDKATYFRFYTSTITAGNVTMTLTERDETVQEILNRKRVPVVRIGEESMQVVGTLTATAFSGPVTGAITGNITGNVTGNLTGNVTGNLTGNTLAISSNTGTSSINLSSFTASGAAIKATNTNDSAASGYYGETISSATAASITAATSTQYLDVAAVALTPGHWILSAQVDFALGTAGTYTNSAAGIGTVTGDDSTGLVIGETYLFTNPPTSGTNEHVTFAGVEKKITSNTTFYLKSRAVYGSGAPTTRGRIIAVRIR